MGGERFQATAGLLYKKDELENYELSQKQFTSLITRFQKEMEGRNFSIRKHLFDYDSVIDKQRQNVYRTRDAILEANEDDEKKYVWLEEMKQQFLLDAQEILTQQVQVAEATGQGVDDLIEVLIKEY